MSFLKRFLQLILAALFLGVPSVVFAAAQAYPSGPAQVSVGQTFQVVLMMQGATDVDTVRLNGSYTPEFLQWKGMSPAGVFQNVSPGTYVDEKGGIFSFGAFSLSSHANDRARVGVLTFKAIKAGTAYVQLTTNSRILSAGQDQLGSVGRLTIVVSPAPIVQEQPQALPSSVPTGTAAISLTSANTPDPNAWYATGTIDASWQVLGKVVKTVYVGFDQSPQGPADTAVSTTNIALNVPSDGVWYVHLNFIFTDGTRQRADLRVQIDRQPPHSVEPVVDQTNVPTTVPNAVRFAALDDVSGIDHYDVTLDGERVTSTSATAYPLSGLLPGMHQVVVTALDRAGNRVSGQTQFVITPQHAQASTPATHASKLLWIWIVSVLLFVLLLTCAWVLIEKRGRRKGRR